MKNYILFVTLIALILSLVACKDNPTTQRESVSKTQSEIPKSSPTAQSQLTNQKENQENIALLSLASNGSSELSIEKHELAYSGQLTPEILVDGLSDLTGLNFSTKVGFTESGIFVCWKNDSTLLSDLNQLEEKEAEFNFNSPYSLRWFMMDSLYLTLTDNFPELVYFCKLGATEFEYVALELNELYPVSYFPIDAPYMGSHFYFNRTDERAEGDEGMNYYLDKDNMIEMYYPEIFASEGVFSETSGLVFDSVQGNETLTYWVNEEAQPIPDENQPRVIDVKDCGNGSVIGYGETIMPINQETGEYGYYAFLWIINPEEYFGFEGASGYASVTIMCQTPEAAEKWYDQLALGAVCFYSANGLDIN